MHPRRMRKKNHTADTYTLYQPQGLRYPKEGFRMVQYGKCSTDRDLTVLEAALHNEQGPCGSRINRPPSRKDLKIQLTINETSPPKLRE